LTSFNNLGSVISHLSKYKFGAHHPDCSYHDHHIIRIFGHPFCLGCFFLYFGILIGIIALWTMFGYGLEWHIIFFIGLLFSPLPYIQMHFQRKWFKILARTGLGIGSTLFLGAPLFLLDTNLFGFLYRIGIIFLYWLIAKHALHRRKKKLDRPCDNCNEGVFPLCNWNFRKMDEILNQNSFNFEEEKFLQSIVENLAKPHDERDISIISASNFD